MATYMTFNNGLYYEVPLPDRVQFVVQTDTMLNFNDNLLVVNASYVNPPIWGYRELHITRVSLIYIANAANTDVFVYVCTGRDPIKYIAVPVSCNCTIKAGTQISSSIPGLDIPIEPRGDPGTTSRVQFILVNVIGVNAADDATIVFEGYYRGEPNPQIVSAPIKTDTTIREINVWPWKRG